MNYKATLITGITAGLLGVGIGAFGAHALKEILIANGRTETFELAVRYQFYHAFALIAAGILQRLDLAGKVAAPLFTAGIIIFSGSLYILSLSGNTIWGAITPIGGLCLISGWVALLVAVAKKT
jgi:uncharacterized membrane protein YgdD (TMEM256/DUF423 family)